MSIWMVLVIAALTYGSRALALVLMPEPSPRLTAILDRIPAPLFAALAGMSLFDGGELVAGPTLAATAGAVLLAPTRSLLLVLLGGLGAYLVAHLVW